MTPEEKASLPPGPWMNEPDREVFEASGLRCVINRHPTQGNLCGYVGVPPSHPLHSIHYTQPHELLPVRSYDPTHNESPDDHFSVHGGITFSSDYAPGEPPTDPPTSEPLWYFGFDCAQCYDLIPGHPRHPLIDRESFYRDIEYVRQECRSLALQLSTFSKEPPTNVQPNVCHLSQP